MANLDDLLRLLGVGSSLISTIMGSKALKKSGQDAAAAADPYAWRRKAQGQAFDDLLKTGLTSRAAEFTRDPNQYTQSPGYQRNITQGVDAINRKAAPTGNLGTSDNRWAELQKYAQGNAANHYGAEFGRRAQQDNNAYRDWIAKVNATGRASNAFGNPADAVQLQSSADNAAIQTKYGGINDALSQVFNPTVRNQQESQNELLRKLLGGGTLW